MVSNRCKIVVKEVLKELGLHFIFVELGEIDIMEELDENQRLLLKTGLAESGLELMDDKRAILIERISVLIVHMIHNAQDLPEKKYSSFISESIGYDYTYLSNIFSEIKGVTIQQYIIINKIERIKELIIYDELNITEIAWKMNYSSVAHLSNQFKKVTGYSPSHFKHLKDRRRSPIEELGELNNTILSNNKSQLND
jgi:AraC-like DNA-binding protein